MYPSFGIEAINCASASVIPVPEPKISTAPLLVSAVNVGKTPCHLLSNADVCSLASVTFG